MSTEIVAKINEVQVIDYQGERVVTFAMMDELHGRAAGTAKRNFHKHRGKMLEGRHFFELRGDEIRTASIEAREQDDHGNKLPIANDEHWEGPTKNRPHETWIVCQPCNFKLRDDGEFKRDSRIQFESFQKRREQKHTPLLMGIKEA